MPENNEDLSLAPEEVAAAVRLADEAQANLKDLAMLVMRRVRLADEAQANLKDLAMLVMRRLGSTGAAGQPAGAAPQPSYWAEVVPAPEGGTLWKLHEGDQCLGVHDYDRGVCRPC